MNKKTEREHDVLELVLPLFRTLAILCTIMNALSHTCRSVLTDTFLYHAKSDKRKLQFSLSLFLSLIHSICLTLTLPYTHHTTYIELTEHIVFKQHNHIYRFLTSSLFRAAFCSFFPYINDKWMSLKLTSFLPISIYKQMCAPDIKRVRFHYENDI